MDLGSLTSQDVDQQDIIDASQKRLQALTRKNADLRPKLLIRVSLDLTTARDASNPYHVSDAFTSVYVESTSSSTALVSLGLISGDDVNLKNNFIKLTQKDAIKCSEPVRGCYITWLAQSGVTMTLVFALDAEIVPGSYLTTISGGVFESYGSAMTPGAPVTVTNAATAIDTAQPNAKKRTIQVLTGAGVYLSGVNTLTGAAGGFPGIFVPVGGTYEWLNTGAIYGITDGGNSNVSINTES